MTKHQNIKAVIYDKRGMVLSVGENSYIKTHPQMALTGKKVGRPEKSFLHAELAAILKCRNLDKAYRIFVSRIGKNGQPALAKPCPICESLIKESGIKIVEHT